VADQFIRVRLTRIENVDLNLFDFDYDLTFVVFFLNAEGRVYARYGGRDAVDPDSRQSLAGLGYTMKSVLRMHRLEKKAFAPRAEQGPRFVRDLSGPRRRRGCLHCHQVKEAIHADLRRKEQWSRDLVWRYPLPENLGFTLDVDRGNVVKAVQGGRPASTAGLKAGDIVQRLNAVPIHSFADAQFALDRAPRTGTIEAVWQRGREVRRGKLKLPEGWRKTDISWRPSVWRLVPFAGIGGTDLTAQEKRDLGLPAKQLAFRQKAAVSSQARAAGIRPGDIILGLDDRPLEGDLAAFQRYVERHYLVGDKVRVNVLRDGKRLKLTMTLVR
jgi:predicted metalloprotease with PDZ domain